MIAITLRAGYAVGVRLGVTLPRSALPSAPGDRPSSGEPNRDCAASGVSIRTGGWVTSPGHTGSLDRRSPSAVHRDRAGPARRWRAQRPPASARSVRSPRCGRIAAAAGSRPHVENHQVACGLCAVDPAGRIPRVSSVDRDLTRQRLGPGRDPEGRNEIPPRRHPHPISLERAPGRPVARGQTAPAGSSCRLRHRVSDPSRLNSLAMYSAVLKLPIDPGSRPPMESSARRKRRSRRSLAVMSEVVAARAAVWAEAVLAARNRIAQPSETRMEST